MSEQVVKQNISTSSLTSSATATLSSNTVGSKRHMTQNYSLIWLDGSIDLSEDDWQAKLTQVQSIVSDVHMFTQSDDCLEFLKNTIVEKVFLIASGYSGQDLIPKIHSMSQLDAIYIFCGNATRHKAWATAWLKIQGVFTSVEQIYKSLKNIIRDCDHEAMPMSFIPKEIIAVASVLDKQNLDKLDPSYMYSLLFKQTILETDEDDMKAIHKLATYCHQHQIFDLQVKRLQREYRFKSPIWWYTDTNFLCGMLNKAIRSFDMESLTKMG
ncbi:unnamed protein product, partial [Rotaria magnacalcarata]